MISIIQHIQYLILNHDCVVIPGLGAFVARYVSASLDNHGNCFASPCREVGFNMLLSHDDGLLTGSVTRREGVSYECARSAVEREVELIHRRLHHEGRVTLDRIGELALNEHGAIEFSPAEQKAIYELPYAFLPDLTLQNIEQPEETVANPIILEVDTVSERNNALRHRALSVAKYAASLVIAFGLGVTLFIQSRNNVDKASLSGNIEIVLPEPEVSPVEEKGEREIVLYTPGEDATATVSNKSVLNKASETTPKHRYYLIVASTRSLAEARTYVKTHSTASHPLRILPSDGRYRVYSASGNNFDALSALRYTDTEFASANPDAWVYTRN